MSKAYIRKIVLLAAIILCCSLCVGRSAVNAMSRTETPDLTEDVYSGANVPAFTGGTEIGSFTGSGTTRTVKYSDTTSSDFSAYKSELVSKGFTIYDENTVDGNYFATLTRDFVTVTLSWFRTGIMQIICERKGDLCPLSDPCKKKGLKKGRTYSVKVKVTDKGNSNYKAKSKNVTLKIKVK